MALPLYEVALDGIRGRLTCDPVYASLSKEESDAFNARFQIPNPDVVFPVPPFFVTYVKPTIRRKNITAGDFTYFSGVDFESHVTHHYDFYDDRLIIGKFCQIASGVEFIMNGANHQMNAATTFPFYILEGWGQKAPPLERLPLKGDTVVGNDVWIGQNATILPGVHIGDGAMIGANSVVGSDVAPYSIVAGNPARQIRKRFDGELTRLLLEFRWWDLPVPEISGLIPLLSDSDLDKVKSALKEKLKS
jgi:virginiamycin A acetyltransferase